MKTLLILRHAKSSWSHTGLSDHDRPLKKRGRRAARRMGELLVDEGLVPQLIISSTAKRARKTAELLTDACRFDGETRLEGSFYQAGPTAYIRVLQAVSDDHDRVMVVGHNPGLEILLEVLAGQTAWLPSGSLAQIQLPIDAWADLYEYAGGTLVALWEPKKLPTSGEDGGSAVGAGR